MPVSLLTSCLPKDPFLKFILHVTNDAQKRVLVILQRVLQAIQQYISNELSFKFVTVVSGLYWVVPSPVP
jgi:hypothetical protein